MYGFFLQVFLDFFFTYVVTKNKVGIMIKFIKLRLNGWKLKTVNAPKIKGNKKTKKILLLRKLRIILLN